MKLIADIIDWLKNYSENNNNLCFVVGVSGGIDSALVSTLYALTSIETHVVSLPINQKSSQLDRARKHSNWLLGKFSNVQFHEIELSDSFEKIKNNLYDYHSDLGCANTKSRLRMLTLYHLSTFYKGLVVGTGNKIEDFGVGFFTKYGDGGVDISPIADLTKTEVRELSKELGIINEIIEAKPTDGLWDDDRTDEEQIGASYEELEWAMEFSNQYEPDSHQKQILKIYNKLNKSNKHKMVSVPVFKKL